MRLDKYDVKYRTKGAKGSKDLVAAILDKVPIAKDDICTFIYLLFEEMRGFLVQGYSVRIRNFGKFYPATIKAKIRRTNQGVTVLMPEIRWVKFRSGVSTSRRMNNLKLGDRMSIIIDGGEKYSREQILQAFKEGRERVKRLSRELEERNGQN